MATRTTCAIHGRWVKFERDDGKVIERKCPECSGWRTSPERLEILTQIRRGLFSLPANPREIS